MTPQTDIVIPIHGTREFPVERLLDDCFTSIRAHTKDYRLIVVDDFSDPECAAVVDRLCRNFPSCVLLRTHVQNWFTKAVNKGLRMVRTPRAVVLNCDTVVDQNWLEELYDVWREVEEQTFKQVGLVGSVLNPHVNMRWRYTIPPHYVTGHCWLVSMEAIARAAEQRGMPGWYLDELNPANAHIRSDVELCHRLNGMNYLTVESFRSAVGHHGGKSWGHLLSSLSVITPEYLRKIDQ